MREIPLTRGYSHAHLRAAWDEASGALHRQLDAEKRGSDPDVSEARVDSLHADRVWFALAGRDLQSPFGVGLGL